MLKNLAVCLALSAFAVSGAPAGAGDCCRHPTRPGVEGTALKVPVQGIVPEGNRMPKPHPVVGAEMVVTDAKTGKEVARVKTDKDGKFSINLAAGDYKIESKYNTHWNFQEKFTVKQGQRVKLPLVMFKYNGPPVPVAPRP